MNPALSVQGVELSPAADHLPGPQAGFLVPQTPEGIVYVDGIGSLFLHGQVIFPAEARPHRVFKGGHAQGLSDLLGQTSIEGADPHGGLVVEHLSYDGQTSAAAGLHPPAGGALNPEVGGIAAVNLIQAVLLEKQGRSQMGDGPGKGTGGAHTDAEAVRGQAQKALPVPEISQPGGIELIDSLPLGVLSRPAAPQPVAALRHPVHFRHSAGNGQGLGKAFRIPQNPGDHQPVLLPGPDRIGPVQRPGPGEPHGIIGPEIPANALGFQPDIGRLLGDPHGALPAPLLQHRRGFRGVQPKALVFRLLRRILLNIVRQPVPAFQGAGGYGDPARRGKGGLHGAHILRVRQTGILFVRKHQHIGAHGAEGLFPLRQAQLHPPVRQHQGAALHPDQSVTGIQGAGLSGKPVKGSSRAGGEHRILIGAQILHIREPALADGGVPVQPAEPVGLLPVSGGHIQIRLHGHPPFTDNGCSWQAGEWSGSTRRRNPATGH